MGLPFRQDNDDMELPTTQENNNIALSENDNTARSPRDENCNVALPSRDENGNMLLQSRQETGTVRLPRRQETGSVWLPARQESGMVGVSGQAIWLCRVLDNLHRNWLRWHMLQYHRTDLVSPQQLVQYGHVPQYYGYCSWPLYIQSVETINNRLYLVQLEKVPFVNFLRKFIVRCLPLSNHGIIVNDIFATFPYSGRGEVYRVVYRVSENYEYLISYDETLVAYRFNI